MEGGPCAARSAGSSQGGDEQLARGTHGHPGSGRLLCARRGMGILPRPWVRQWGQRPLGTRHGSLGPMGEGGAAGTRRSSGEGPEHPGS